MNNDVLSLDQLDRALKVTSSVFENEISKYREEDQQFIMAFLAEIVTMPKYQLILETPVMNLIESMGQKPVIVEYIMSVSSSLAIYISCSDITHDRLIKTLVNGYEANQACMGDLTALPSGLKESVSTSKDWLEEFFTQNFWLVSILLYNLT